MTLLAAGICYMLTVAAAILIGSIVAWFVQP